MSRSLVAGMRSFASRLREDGPPLDRKDMVTVVEQWAGLLEGDLACDCGGWIEPGAPRHLPGCNARVER